MHSIILFFRQPGYARFAAVRSDWSTPAGWDVQRLFPSFPFNRRLVLSDHHFFRNQVLQGLRKRALVGGPPVA